MGVKYSQLPNATTIAADDYIAILDTSDNVLRKTVVDHSLSTTAFGPGSPSKYGHNKIVDNLSSTSLINGEALSAHQGYIIADNMGQYESGDTAAFAHALGDFFMWKGQFVKATAAIQVGQGIGSGNTEATRIGDQLKIATGSSWVPGEGLVANGTTLNVAFGTTAGSVCEGNDPRLSDARTPLSHNQAASTITTGTLAGRVNANAAATTVLANAQVRNIYAGTADMTAGTSALATGTIYIQYEA